MHLTNRFLWEHDTSIATGAETGAGKAVQAKLTYYLPWPQKSSSRLSEPFLSIYYFGQKEKAPLQKATGLK